LHSNQGRENLFAKIKKHAVIFYSGYIRIESGHVFMDGRYYT